MSRYCRAEGVRLLLLVEFMLRFLLTVLLKYVSGSVDYVQDISKDGMPLDL